MKFIEGVAEHATEIFFLGDMIDFWFEWRHCVPKGYVRLLGAVARLTDGGLPVWWMVGNHDQWVREYLSEEVGVRLIKQPFFMERGGRCFTLVHGHKLGNTSAGDALVNWLFENRVCRGVFALLHPDVAIWLGHLWARTSRKANPTAPWRWGREYLYEHVREMLGQQANPPHYILAGHRHTPCVSKLSPHTTYINIGDWLEYRTYAVFDGDNVTLHYT